MKVASKRNIHYFKTSDGVEPAKVWLKKLKDIKGKARISARIRRAQDGNFGDSKSIKGAKGVFELRVDFGPGYRLYFGVDDKDNLIILLIGGDKSSQKKDVEKAKEFWDEYKENYNDK